MCARIILIALATASLVAASETSLSKVSNPSTELVVRGEDGEGIILPRVKWNDETAEAIYKICTVAGAGTYAACRLAQGGTSTGVGIPCNVAVAIALAGAAAEAAVKCDKALKVWKKERHTAADLEATSYLLPDPDNPPIDTITQTDDIPLIFIDTQDHAANVPLPPSSAGSRSSSSGRSKKKKDPPVDTLDQAANVPLPPSRTGSQDSSSGASKKKGAKRVVVRHHARRFR